MELVGCFVCLSTALQTGTCFVSSCIHLVCESCLTDPNRCPVCGKICRYQKLDRHLKPETKAFFQDQIPKMDEMVRLLKFRKKLNSTTIQTKKTLVILHYNVSFLDSFFHWSRFWMTDSLFNLFFISSKTPRKLWGSIPNR